MELEEDVFDDNWTPKIREYPADNPDRQIYNELINDLIELEKEFSIEDYNWLKEEDRAYKYGYESWHLHYFLFCIDWASIYSADSSIKITTYDILKADNSKKKHVVKLHFDAAYKAIKKMFDGEISTSEELINCRETFLDRLSTGLNELPSTYKSKKGLREFFKFIFEKLGSVAYETTDFIRPYLIDEDQRSKFLIDLFYRFIPAIEVAKIFNKKYLSAISGIEIDTFFALHVLLRHVDKFKINHNLYENSKYDSEKIKDGTGKEVKITACKSEKGGISVISKDGEFYLPNFSIYPEIRSEECNLSFENIADRLYQLLKVIAPIFIKNINPDKSPNIIYYNGSLYGLEFDKYRQEKIIQIGSFYPLNSEEQVKFGISQKDYDLIVNKQDIPLDEKIKIRE